MKSVTPNVFLPGLAALLAAVGCGGAPDAPDAADDESAATQDPAALTAATLTRPVCTTLNSAVMCLHFSSTAAGAQDYTIRNELVRLIDGVPKGARIRGTFFALGAPAIGDALIRAHARGVDVRLTLDGGNATDPHTAAARKVRAALGPAKVSYCSGGGAHGCITSNPNGIAHTKLLTFSRTTAPDGVAYDDVSWISSYNALDGAGGGSNASNNSLTTYNSPVSYAGYNATLDHMWNEDHFANNDYFDPTQGSSRGFFYDSNARTEAYMSPSVTSSTDNGLIYDQLLRVTAGPGCVIRVMHAGVSGSLPLAIDRLIALKNGGCQVFFMVDVIDGYAAASNTSTLHKLHANGIEVRRSYHSLHDKVVLIDGLYDGVPRKIFLTGSHNWTSTSSYKNDEALIRVYDNVLWGTTSTGMYGHFLDLWQAPNTIRCGETC